MCKELVNCRQMQKAGKFKYVAPLGEAVMKLKKNDDKLEAVSRQLDEIKTTLNVLLEKRNCDRESIEKSIRLNVEELVLLLARQVVVSPSTPYPPRRWRPSRRNRALPQHTPT